MLTGLKEGRFFKVIYWDEFLQNFYKAQDQEHRALLLVSYILGLSGSECKILARENVDVDKNIIKFKVYRPKTKKERLVAIPIMNRETEFLRDYIYSKFPKEYLFPELVKQKNQNRYFILINSHLGIGREETETFIGSTGETISQSQFYPFSFYIFKHNLASRLAEMGTPERLIRYWFGKPLDPFTTMRYYIHPTYELVLQILPFVKKLMKT
jgi:integrase